MKIRLALTLLVGGSMPAIAGEFDSGKGLAAKNVEFKSPSETEIGFYVPGFLPWSDMTIGIGGVETHARVGGDVLLKNLESLALGGLEGRKGKFGFILEGLYLNLGFDGETPGRLLTTVDVNYEQIIAEATLTYRIYESDRAWIELLAGVRYFNVDSAIGLTADAAGVREVSNDLSEAIVSRSAAVVKEALDQRLAVIVAGLPAPAADLSAATLDNLDRGIRRDVDALSTIISRRVREGSSPNRIGDRREADEVGLNTRISSDRRVRELIRDYARASLSAQIEERRAAASATVAAARAAVRTRARQALARAERRLADGLERRINAGIANFPVEGSKGWVDPFIGLRGHVLLADNLYFVARADCGGWGGSSEEMYNLYGALGTQLKENVTLELGIRHLGVEYLDGGFYFDSSFTGPFSAVMIRF